MKTAVQCIGIVMTAAWAINAQTQEQSPQKEIDIRIAQIHSQLADMKLEGDALDKALSKAWADFYAADDTADVSKESGFIQSGSIRKREMDSLARSLALERATLERKKQLLIAAPVCSALYTSTIDKKASDLTVRETNSIKACRQMDLYR